MKKPFVLKMNNRGTPNPTPKIGEIWLADGYSALGQCLVEVVEFNGGQLYRCNIIDFERNRDDHIDTIILVQEREPLHHWHFILNEFIAKIE